MRPEDFIFLNYVEKMKITLSKSASIDINTNINTIDIIEHKNKKQEIIVQQIPIDGSQTDGYINFIKLYQFGSYSKFGYFWWFLSDDEMDRLLSKWLPDDRISQIQYFIDVYYKDELGNWVEREDLGICIEFCEYYFDSNNFKLITNPLTGARKIRERIQKELDNSEWFMTISM